MKTHAKNFSLYKCQVKAQKKTEKPHEMKHAPQGYCALINCTS